MHIIAKPDSICSSYAHASDVPSSHQSAIVHGNIRNNDFAIEVI
jgi:hypothetical protein